MVELKTSVIDFDFPEPFHQLLVKKWNISDLFPPQSEAIIPILNGRNTVVAMPTASGKSLVAYMGIINKLINEKPNSKALYIVPLKALASEKYEELVEIGNVMNLKIKLSIGDRESNSISLTDADILVCTSEKMDSLMRNNSDFLDQVSIVVADEVHLMQDSTRGPTMEVNLTKVKYWKEEIQIIALSATVGNSEDIAEWLNADLVLSDWRPVTLEQSTVVGLEIEPRKLITSSLDDDFQKLPPPRTINGPVSAPTWAILRDTVENGGQLLIFVSTRKSAQSEARRLSERLLKYIIKEKPGELEKLEQISSDISSQIDDSSITENLSNAVRGGVAFHHAGLTGKDRKKIEEGFRNKAIHCLVATPTLAAGVNLPARRVLIRDMKRWDDGYSRWISVMEIKQMLGRAGRPKYDKKGEAWLLCKGQMAREQADEISKRYILGEPEDIQSKLAAEPPLRMHLLSSVATGGLTNLGSLRKFFKTTFFGFKSNNNELQDRIDNILTWLVDEEMIIQEGIDTDLENEYAFHLQEVLQNENTWDDNVPDWVKAAKENEGIVLIEEDINEIKHIGNSKPKGLGFEKANEIISPEMRITKQNSMVYSASDFGNRVCQLYLDPMSGAILRAGLRRAIRRIVRNQKDMPLTNFSILYLISSTPDFISFWPRDSEIKSLRVKSSIEDANLLDEINIEDYHLSYIKSSSVIEDWIQEESMRSIENKNRVGPGDLRMRVDLAEWLLYASKEIVRADKIFGNEYNKEKEKLIQMIDTLRNRVQHGCKEELLQLVSLSGIGRKRARDLVDFGVNSPIDILKISERDKNRLIDRRGWGPKLVDKIINQVNNISTNTELISKSKLGNKRKDDEPLPGEKKR